MSHCSHKTTVDVYSVWPEIRDHAKPLTPLDAYFLMMARMYCAPSKAHIKRVKKLRLTITKPPVLPAPDTSERAVWNSCFALGQVSRAVDARAATIERHVINSNRPIVPERVAVRGPIWAKPIPKSEPKSEWDIIAIDANIARLERAHRAEMAKIGR